MPAKLNSLKVDLKLPGATISGTWAFDAKEKQAAWEVYVELVTRIAVAGLDPQGGSLREALTSLYTLFATTRDVLRKYGPDVAIPKGEDKISFGYLVLWMLNAVLRPVLTEWHTRLSHYESLRDPKVSPIEHEQAWDDAATLRKVIEDTRVMLTKYARVFEQVSGIPSLIPPGS